MKGTGSPPTKAASQVPLTGGPAVSSAGRGSSSPLLATGHGAGPLGPSLPRSVSPDPTSGAEPGRPRLPRNF